MNLAELLAKAATTHQTRQKRLICRVGWGAWTKAGICAYQQLDSCPAGTFSYGTKTFAHAAVRLTTNT